jgi:hypothetical protein
MEEMRSAYKSLVGKRVGKIPYGRPRLRRKDDIKIYLKEDVNCFRIETSWFLL